MAASAVEELVCLVRADKHFKRMQPLLSAWSSTVSIPLHLWSEAHGSDNSTEPNNAATTTSSIVTQAAPLVQALEKRLETKELGHIVLFSPAMGSTQTLLHQQLVDPAVPEHVLCLTNQQVQGHGRGSNVWTAPMGCLTFSFKSVFENGSNLPFVQYLVSLAIVKAVETIQSQTMGGKKTLSEVKIKWPNDIYAQNMKIGGILCQSEYKNQQFNVTTGIGINITNREPTTCVQQVLSEENNPCEITKEEFLATFCNVYEPMQALFKEKGFEPFMDEYLERWLHSNQVVQVSSDDGTDGYPMHAVIKGLTDTGCLLAIDQANPHIRYELYPDGNSFDFFKGLLKRKLF